MYATTLLRLCDLVAPLVLILRTSMRKANLFCNKVEIQNIALQKEELYELMIANI